MVQQVLKTAKGMEASCWHATSSAEAYQSSITNAAESLQMQGSAQKVVQDIDDDDDEPEVVLDGGSSQMSAYPSLPMTPIHEIVFLDELASHNLVAFYSLSMSQRIAIASFLQATRCGKINRAPLLVD